MKLLLSLTALVALCCAVESRYSPPKVQVYSQKPGLFGEDNVLICHVSNFHPPDITIRLTKDGVELPSAQQTDLAFKPDWHFHLTKSVVFTPKDGEAYSCQVKHATNPEKPFLWETNV